MFERLLLAPTWVHVLLHSLLFWALVGGAQWIDGVRDPLRVAAVAGVAGLAVGTFNGVSRARRLRAARGDIDPAVLRVAARATGRPPVPPDPAVRAEAVRLARFRLGDRDSRWYTAGAVTLLLVVVIGVLLATTQDQPMGWWVPAVALVAAGVTAERDVRVRRRLSDLQEVAA